MKFACRHSIAALALLWCVIACAAPYPTENQLRTAIGAVAQMLQSEALEVEILDARKEGLTEPLMAAGLNLSTGVCLVFYNTAPEDGLNQFFDAIDLIDLPVMLKALAVHEAAHCIEQREAYVRRRFTKVLPPDSKRDNLTVQGYLSVVKSGALVTWGEAFADIASVLYLKRTVPDHWLRLSRSIAAMRRDFAWKWPEHDTSAWLQRIIAADIGAGPDQSLFETAFSLRRRFRPGE